MVEEQTAEDRGQRTEIAVNGVADTPQSAIRIPHSKEMPQIAYDLQEGRFAIGRDSLNRAIAGLDHGQARILERFHRWCTERNIPRSQLGTLLRKPNGEFYSVDSIYQTLTGRRTESGASIAPICKAIDEFLARVEPTTKTEGFIETRLAREVWRFMDRVIDKAKVSFLFGDMSLGKSTIAGEYARRHPDCLYTRMPTRGQLGDYLKECAEKMAMGVYSGVSNLRNRVIDGIPRGLIIDEADQCFQSIKNSLGLATLDFIREAYDKRKRGIILIMDHHGRNELIRGQNAARLKRLWRRRLSPLQLPSSLYESDAVLFAESVGLTAAPDEAVSVNVKFKDDDGRERSQIHRDNPKRLQDTVVAKDGLGVWLMLLEDAADLAKEARKQISWGAVIKAHALFTAMEQRVQEGK
jgi:DNA transposition AAA+ family ATPase